MKGFAELEKEVGFGLAVTIYGKDLPTSFYEELKRPQWKEIYEASKGTSMREEAVRGIYKTSATIDEYIEAHNLAPAGSDLRKEIRKTINGFL
ncbi:MAG: hypothetical protein ABH919_01190 [bacterium]